MLALVGSLFRWRERSNHKACRRHCVSKVVDVVGKRAGLEGLEVCAAGGCEWGGVRREPRPQTAFSSYSPRVHETAHWFTNLLKGQIDLKKATILTAVVYYS